MKPSTILAIVFVVAISLYHYRDSFQPDEVPCHNNRGIVESHADTPEVFNLYDEHNKVVGYWIMLEGVPTCYKFDELKKVFDDLNKTFKELTQKLHKDLER